MLTHANLHFSGAAAHAAAYVPGVNRGLGTLPLSHAYGLLVTIAGLHSPEPGIAVLLRWFDPDAFLDPRGRAPAAGQRGGADDASDPPLQAA